MVFRFLYALITRDLKFDSMESQIKSEKQDSISIEPGWYSCKSPQLWLNYSRKQAISASDFWSPAIAYAAPVNGHKKSPGGPAYQRVFYLNLLWMRAGHHKAPSSLNRGIMVSVAPAGANVNRETNTAKQGRCAPFGSHHIVKDHHLYS